MKNWLALADKLPVHDLLDRVYFEGDVLARYAAVLPPEMRAKVRLPTCMPLWRSH